VGYPKHLNTKEDYLFVMANFPRGRWEKDFQLLLQDAVTWLNTGQLENAELGVTDGKRMVVSTGGEDGMGKEQHYQYEYKDDPNCKLVKLGFTKAEVEKFLA